MHRGSDRLSDCDQCAGFLSGSDEVAKVHIFFRGSDDMGFFIISQKGPVIKRETTSNGVSMPSQFQASKHSHKLNACNFCCLNLQFL